jgi:hypothetical protein
MGKQAQIEHEEAVRDARYAEYVKNSIADSTVMMILRSREAILQMIGEGMLVPTEIDYPTY